MRKIYFLLTLCFFGIVNAQIVNIPDANFKAKLLAASPTAAIAYNAADVKIKIDINNDNEIQQSEALLVYTLTVINSSIADMTGIESFINLKNLYCSGNQITSLNVTAFNNLENLQCHNNQITSLNLTGMSNLKTLYCHNNQLTSLNLTGLNNLAYLDCKTNLLNGLNLSGLLQLKTLICKSNQISGIDLSNQSLLNYLDCDDNQLTTLNLQNNTVVKVVMCKNNQLTSLNLMNQNILLKVECDFNQITNLQIATPNNSLNRLTFSTNQITNINNLNTFTALNYLNCSANPLTSLNITNLVNLQWLLINSLNSAIFPLNNSNGSSFIVLEYLYFTFTDTEPVAGVNFNFGLLPSLIYLNCGSSNLSALNLNSSTLATLRVSYNQLTTLDLSNLPNLQELEFWSNPLNNIVLNYNAPLTTFYGGSGSTITSYDLSQFDLLTNVSLNGNSQLVSFNIKNGMNSTLCYFGFCPNLQYICADEGEVDSIQTTINSYGYTNCMVNTYCSFEPGGTSYTIQGNNKLDLNTNGCDFADASLASLKFNLTNGATTGSLFSNTTGNYSLAVPEGSYTLTPAFENPSYFSISPTSLTINFPSQTSPVNQNFCITPNGTHNDLEVTLLPINDARPGFDTKYKILYKNKGTNPQSGTLNLTFEDNLMDLISSSVLPNNQSFNALTWNYTNLLPMETRGIDLIFNINSPVETPPVNIGDQLDFVALINPISGDELLIDNTSNLKQIVVGSYDPNDKTCVEGNIVTPESIGQYVHYMIRFENTGTFAAENIVIKDLIDTAKFDITTLIPLSSSHSFVSRITNTNQLEFIFENINLPFDDANNDGYVAFKIKTKPTLVVGDTFSNTASIYFDYNFPIVTNTATTTIQTLANSDFEFGTYFTLAPNPAKELLQIQSTQSVEISSLNIYNTLGQLVLVITEPTSSIDVSHLKSGSYFIKVVSDKGTSSRSFIKE